MSEGQLKARRKWLLSKKVMKRHPHSNQAFWMHLRGFHKGDIRCRRCDKWIDPIGDRFPREWKEIKISPGGKKMHDSRYCKYGNGYGVAIFATVSRHSPYRRKRVDAAHRY
jgi:hypothetical protein